MPWSLLGILLAVCAVMCAVGFYKFVYFLSIGYGFAIAGGGIAVLVMYLVNPTNTPVWIVLVETALFIAYGVRLSGFLLVRELKNVSFRKTDVAKDTLAKNNEKKGATMGVGSKSVPLGIPYIFVSTSYMRAKALFFSFTGTLSPRLAARIS